MDEPVRGQHLVPWVSVVEAPLSALPVPPAPLWPLDAAQWACPGPPSMWSRVNGSPERLAPWVSLGWPRHGCGPAGAKLGSSLQLDDTVLCSKCELLVLCLRTQGCCHLATATGSVCNGRPHVSLLAA